MKQIILLNNVKHKIKTIGWIPNTSILFKDTCHLNLPESMVKNNPLDIDNIKEQQNADVDTQHWLRKYPQW